MYYQAFAIDPECSSERGLQQAEESCFTVGGMPCLSQFKLSLVN